MTRENYELSTISKNYMNYGQNLWTIHKNYELWTIDKNYELLTQETVDKNYGLIVSLNFVQR